MTFGLDRIETVQRAVVLGEPLWKYLASLIYILLAVCVAKLLDLIAAGWLKRLAARTETKLDDVLVELFSGPIKVVAFTVLVNIGLNVFEWPERARVYLSKVLVLVVAASLTWVTVKMTGLLLDTWRERFAHEADGRFDAQLFSVIRKSLNAFIIIMPVLVTAQNICINITAALTSLSIGGLAVGLAAQDTLANLFGAVAVFTDKPFRVGDQIKLEGTEGTVEAVGLRSTRGRSLNGELVAIPNKTVGHAAIVNISRRPFIKTVLHVSLDSTLPAAKEKRALAILEESYRGHAMTQDVNVSFNQFVVHNLNVLVLHWWKGTDYAAYLAGLQQMNVAVKEG